MVSMKPTARHGALATAVITVTVGRAVARPVSTPGDHGPQARCGALGTLATTVM